MADRAQEPAPRGRMIEIGAGRALHAVFAGPVASPEPLIVLEAGSFGFSADWADVQARLAARGLRSLAYDRAGLGFSRPGPEPRDSEAVVHDLERLLLHAGEAGPFILCGHSMAGLHVRLFARRHHERVAGLVLVDATTPEAMNSRLVSAFVGQFGHASRLAAWGAGAGLLTPLSDLGLGDAIGLPGAPGVEKRWAFSHPGHNHWAAREVACWAQSAGQGLAAGALEERVPVAVILAGASGEMGGVRAMQTAPARASRHGYVENVAGASHANVLAGPSAEAILRGVAHVLAAA
jgi:pimeloyl-ACP methyl ester carboxylesterase